MAAAAESAPALALEGAGWAGLPPDNEAGPEEMRDGEFSGPWARPGHVFEEVQERSADKRKQKEAELSDAETRENR